MELIGRLKEIEILEEIYSSKKPEFLALYGRRRIGKTYLIRQFFGNKSAVFFNITGTKNGRRLEQLKHFTAQISSVFYQGIPLATAINWDAAFSMLTTAIKQLPKNRKIILFLDELPWMVTPKSGLLETIDYFWNQHWSNDPRIKFIICGSSASWIINKIIKNKAGLHNRITRKMRLESFTLGETKDFLEGMGCKFNDQQILMIYMVTGGVPYYLINIKKRLSAAQNIEHLCLDVNGLLFEEFDQLFSSLFENPNPYISMLRKLASKHSGIGKRELLKSLGLSMLGMSGEKLIDDLEQAGFIMSFKPYQHKRQGIQIRLIDEYTLFYLKWIEPIKNHLHAPEAGFWKSIQGTPAWHSWMGYAFESICYKHIPMIRKAIGLEPDSLASAWLYAPRDSSINGAQIDLLFSRTDDAITLCEIKCTESPYVITKEVVEGLIRKMTVFKEVTKTRKQLFMVLISASGVKNNYYAEEYIDGVVCLENLFAKA